jgi:UDP-glucose 4-epimerase
MSLPKRVLVTGGAGFLGAHLIPKLRSLGVEVRVLDDLSSGARSALPSDLPGADVFVGDVRDTPLLARATNGCETVVHLADRPFAREGLDVGTKGTLAVLEAAKSAGVARVVLASSCSVYGASGSAPFLETRAPGPVSQEGAVKVSAEAILRSFAEQGAFQAVALRFFHVYGRGRISSPTPGVLARFGQEVAAGRPPQVFGSGEVTRDFVHVDDAVEAIRLALERRLGAWTVANVGTGVATSIRSAAESVCEALGRLDLEPVSVDPPPGPLLSSFADLRYARTVLGFQPQVPVAKGLARKDFHLPFEGAKAPS